MLLDDDKRKYLGPTLIESLHKANALLEANEPLYCKFNYANINTNEVLNKEYSTSADMYQNEIRYIHAHLHLLSTPEVKDKISKSLSSMNVLMNNVVAKFDQKYLDMILSNNDISKTLRSAWYVFKNRSQSKVFNNKDGKALRHVTQSFKYLLLDVFCQALNSSSVSGDRLRISADLIAATIYYKLSGQTEIMNKIISFIFSNMTLTDLKALPLNIWFPAPVKEGEWDGNKYNTVGEDGIKYTLLYGNSTHFLSLIEMQCVLLYEASPLKSNELIYIFTDVQPVKHAVIFNGTSYVQISDSGENAYYNRALTRFLRSIINEAMNDSGDGFMEMFMKHIESSMLRYHMYIRNNKYNIKSNYEAMFNNPKKELEMLKRFSTYVTKEVEIAKSSAIDRSEVENYALTVIRANFETNTI